MPLEAVNIKKSLIITVARQTEIELCLVRVFCRVISTGFTKKKPGGFCVYYLGV